MVKLQRRLLSQANLVDKEGFVEKVDIVKSFEIELVSEDDPELSIPVKYSIVKFDSDYLQVQIDNKDSAIAEAPSEYKTLRIVFYGTDLFKAKETNEQIRFGTTVSWPRP